MFRDKFARAIGLPALACAWHADRRASRCTAGVGRRFGLAGFILLVISMSPLAERLSQWGATGISACLPVGTVLAQAPTNEKQPPHSRSEIRDVPPGSSLGFRVSNFPEAADEAIIRQVSIDEAGVIVYIKEDGIYTFGRGGGVKRQVAVGDRAPRTGGVFARFLDVANATVSTGPLGLGRELRIVFKAAIEGGSPGVGIFLFGENQGVIAIALPGDIAPDTGGGVFSGFPGRVLINAEGTIMFKATVAEGRAAEGLFFVPPRFLRGEADIGSVAIQGDAATQTGGGAYSSFGAYSLSQIMLPLPVSPFILTIDLFGFVANVQGGRVSQGLYTSSLVVVTTTPLRLELQARAQALVGDNAAGLRGESTYASFEDVVVTSKGEIVFRARLDGGEASEGIFQIAFIGPIPLGSIRVLQGARAPIHGADVRFASFGLMVGNNTEELVFEADLEGDGPAQGLFSVTLGPLTLLSETLSVGDQAPGTGSGVYGRLGPLAINDDGRVVFQARISGGNTSEAVYSELAKRAKLVDRIPDRPPIITPLGEVETDEGVTIEVPVVAHDPDGDPIRLSLSNAPDFVSFTDNQDGTGRLRIAPDFTDAGITAGVAITAVEEGRDPPLESQDSFSIIVNNVNRAPQLRPITDQVVDEGQTLHVAVEGSDPDPGDVLTLTLSGAPDFVALELIGNGSGRLRISPGFQDAGTYPGISLSLQDNGSPPMEDRVSFTLVVNNVNRAPLLAAIPDHVVVENTVVDIPVSATDPDGDQLSFSLSNNPGFVTLMDHGDGSGVIRVAPGSGDAGTYPIEVTARDGGSPPMEDRRRFNLRVRPPNNAPRLEAIGDQVVDVGQSVTIMISATDPDGDAIRLTLEGAPGFVSLTDNGDGRGILMITPAPNETGIFANVTITATDDGPPNLSTRETLSITVRPSISAVQFERLPFRQLVVEGSGFLTDEAQIEVNGVPLQVTFFRGQQPDGTSTRLLGRDERLSDLLPRGTAVQVTVFNPSRGVRSAPVTFTRT